MEYHDIDADINYYLLSPDGRCIIRYGSSDMDKDLLGGLVVAVLSMSSLAGFEGARGFDLTYFLDDRDINLRLIKSKREFETTLSRKSLYGLLFFERKDYFDDVCYRQLNNLNETLTNSISDNYFDDIQALLRQGNMGDLNALGGYVNEQVALFREHMHASYLLGILGKSSNIVKKEKVTSLISDIGRLFLSDLSLSGIHEAMRGYHERVRALALEPNSKTFNNIIRKVNYEERNVWKLFKVPLIEVGDDSH